MEAKNQHWIQNHVQNPAEHHAGAGVPGVPLAAQQMAQRQANHRWHAAQHHNPEEIVLRVSVSIRAGTQKIQQRPADQITDERKAGRHRRAAPKAEGRDIFDFPCPFDAQHPRDEAAASQPKQVSQSGEQIKPGGHQGHRRHHVGVPNLSDEEGVSQVVDHGHHLADHCGDCQGGYRPGYRDCLEQFPFCKFSHGFFFAFFPDILFQLRRHVPAQSNLFHSSPVPP